MDTEKRFRTKTGFCHILSDKIVLTRDGMVGNLAKVTVGNSISRILLIYGLVTLGLIYFAFDNFKKQDHFMAVLLLLFAVYLIYGIIASLNNSATRMIDRKSIQQIKFKKGITGLTRARFEVIFTDDQGKSKKRLIMLPGSLTGGQTDTDIAYKIMVEEKLI